MSSSFQNKLRQIQTRIPMVVQRIPGVVKVEGMKFIADNFKQQGFEEKPGQYKKWAKIQRVREFHKKTFFVGHRAIILHIKPLVW